MWRSRCRTLIFFACSAGRPSIRIPSPPAATIIPPESVISVGSPSPWNNATCRFLSSSPQVAAAHGDTDPFEQPAVPESTCGGSSGGEEKDRAVPAEAGGWNISGDGGSVSAEDNSLSSLWDEVVADVDDANEVFANASSKSAEGIDVEEEVIYIKSVVDCTAETDIEDVFTKKEFNINVEVFASLMEALTDCSFGKLLALFKVIWANYESVKSARTVGVLVAALSNLPDVKKKEAYALWDIIKEIGKENGLLATETLNLLIAIFWKFGKSRAALEAFEKFDEFGCRPDGDTYYFTIEALGKRSVADTAWKVCEKMIQSERFPDENKLGEIILLFCRRNKVKKAKLLYLMAKEKKICLPVSTLDYLINALSKKKGTVREAIPLLNDYEQDSLKHASKYYAAVVHGLCKAKDPKEAKKLLMKMVNLGPAPGPAVFNYVITALSKAGDIEDAISLMKLMDNRGLRPDIYIYSVIMNGYAMGGLMDEARKLLQEAKRRHQNLTPVCYHILIRGYCKMEEFDKALECLKEMREDGVKPNCDEYNKLIKTLCLKALDWRTAEKLIKEMEGDGLYLKVRTRSLVAAVRQLEEEELQSSA